jgi:NitT/TauT family transport system permease protein
LPAINTNALWFRALRLVAFYALVLGAWQLVAVLELWPSYTFPSPEGVFNEARGYLENSILFDATKQSLQRLAIGYALSFVVGVALGVLLGVSRWADETVGTLVLGLQSLPSITWLPISLMWFGLNERAIIFVVLMGSLFAIAISARDGVRNIPAIYRRAGRTFGARRWQMIRYVTLPAMLPSMAQGLKLGWSFAWRSLMAAEIIRGGAGSLGGLLEVGRSLNNIDVIVLMMIVIMAVGLLVDRLVFGRLEGWVRERWGLAGA